MSKYSVICADPPYGFSDSLSMSDVKRGAKANYPTMSIKDIKELPVKDISEPDGCILALWVPGSLLQEGLDIMKAWGFTHKQTYVWVKTKKDPTKDIRNTVFDFIKYSSKKISEVTQKSFKDYISNTAKITNLLDLEKGSDFIKNILSFGMGHLFRQSHEICLIGINNNKIYKKLMNRSQRSVSFSTNLKHSAKPEHLQNSLEIMFPDSKKIELFARRKREGWHCIGNEVCGGDDIRASLKKIIDAP